MHWLQKWWPAWQNWKVEKAVEKRFTQIYIFILQDCGHHTVSRTCWIVLVKLCKPDELSWYCFTTIETIWYKKGARLEQDRCATGIIPISSGKWVFIAAHEKWFGKCITEGLVLVQDCYVVEVTESYSCVGLLEHNDHRTSTTCLYYYVFWSNEL